MSYDKIPHPIIEGTFDTILESIGIRRHSIINQKLKLTVYP